MKKLLFILIILILLIGCSNANKTTNCLKEIATKYCNNRNTEFNSILTDNFNYPKYFTCINRENRTTDAFIFLDNEIENCKK